jgi:Ser/Thr protein kinase RdoA (MazF antagonist)
VSKQETKTRPPRTRKRARREEQAALLAHLRRRERRVYEALLMILDGKLLRSFAVLMDFVVGLAQRGPR